jgi:catechol 2,3-dioxygenase-like lactoylglutathione lyase family enzyme
LTDSHALNIQVFTLGEGPDATEIKLMQLPGVTSQKVDHQYIHSSLGFSYLTIHIRSTDAALARLKRAGVQPIAEGPVAIPGTDWFLTNVRDPDGNIIELVGPR